MSVIENTETRTVTELVRDYLNGASDIADPHIVASEMVRSLSRSELEAVAIHYLPAAVTQYAVAIRNASPINTVKRPNKWQVASADYWQKFMNRRENVAGEWKLLKDCTVDDVLTIANERHKMSTAYLDMAMQYESLAAKLSSNGAITVGQLTADDIADLSL